MWVFVCLSIVTLSFIFADMFQRLELIDQTRTDWTVRVRVTRMWPSFDANGIYIGFNLILLDAEVTLTIPNCIIFQSINKYNSYVVMCLIIWFDFISSELSCSCLCFKCCLECFRTSHL